jgi:type IV pilus assembly protein PilC
MKFLWKGLQAGDFSSGVIDALTEEEAVYLLKQQGVIITEIYSDESVSTVKTTKVSVETPKNLKRVKIKGKQLLLFTRKLSAMLGSGLAVVPALEMLRDQSEEKGLRQLLSEVVDDVNAGIPISKALEKYPDTFDSVYINLIKAGESSGSLESFLQKICISLEKKIKIISSLKSALTYPMILLIVAVGVIMVMMTFVVPVFAEMYSGNGAPLPGPTAAVMSISDFIRSPMALVLLIIFVVFFIVLRQKIKTNLALKTKFDKKILDLPVFGDLIRNSAIARLASVLANLVSAGVGLIEALEIARQSINNEYMKEGIENIKRKVYSGNTLEFIMKDDPRFPETFKAFVAVGEKTGKLNDMLGSIANYYEDEFDGSVDRLSQMLEPAMILFLGITIGFILVAMYMPIFSMGKAMG